jgi:type III restriction enzyme
LRESDSPLTRHFVVVAPNLTVFERLRDDFKPVGGGPDIFMTDPIIPDEWRGDWNLSVVLQDEAGGAATGGTLYLTNIHRLHDPAKRRTREPETYDWVGPTVSRAKALDTGAALRERVTSHEKIMVLNDEAHHLWDPDSAWNETIAWLHDTTAARTGGGIAAQLDFTATPKDNHGRIFQHVVCDAPLGEAVDAGIVKTPIIGRGEGLTERASGNASERFEQHLTIGYKRWQKSVEEWQHSGKKPLLFVMTEDTEAADQIARRLNSDPIFKDLNNRTVNLHTRLKGRIRWMGGRQHGYPVFEESESDISDDDLKELRKLSRELDSGKSPYQCIVSVLMLREGWDVRNVTTIVPLRPYSSPANILPEQTLGRGLRRMEPHGNIAEVVAVVEHPAFVRMYQEQLNQEGVPIEAVDVDDIPSTTVTIYPDRRNKDCEGLDIELPRVSPGYSRIMKLEGLTIDDVRRQFQKYRPLPLGQARPEEIQYVGRTLLTDETVETMKLKLPLLENGVGAVSFFREELEQITRLRGTHPVLAPLLDTFLTEILFEEKTSLFDQRLICRLGDPDVREYVRATFVPIILERTTKSEEREPEGEIVRLSGWRPYQATHSPDRPALPAERTLFNLVPCNRELEVGLTKFLDRAPDVTAFAKNAGPQALRIDYLTGAGRLSLYTPDFIVRLNDGHHLVVETKGRVDRDVPMKARAAGAWCKSAGWEYVYVPEGVFKQATDTRMATLQRMCAPSLRDLIQETETRQLSLQFDEGGALAGDFNEFIPSGAYSELPLLYQRGIRQAVEVFQHFEKKEGFSFAPVFACLLGPMDEAAKSVLFSFLDDSVPADSRAQREFFSTDRESFFENRADFIKRQAVNLRRTLVDRGGLMPIGLLQWCLEYARQSRHESSGVFAVIRSKFADVARTDLLEDVTRIYEFRNRYVAHQDEQLTDARTAKAALGEWARGLHRIWKLCHE